MTDRSLNRSGHHACKTFQKKTPQSPPSSSSSSNPKTNPNPKSPKQPNSPNPPNRSKLKPSTMSKDQSPPESSCKRKSQDADDADAITIVNAVIDFRSKHGGSASTPTTMKPVFDAVKRSLHRTEFDQAFSSDAKFESLMIFFLDYWEVCKRRGRRSWSDEGLLIDWRHVDGSLEKINEAMES